MLTVDDLPAHIPRLEELFETCGLDYDLSIDLKDPATFRAIIDLASRNGFDLDRLWLCHTDLPVLESMRREMQHVQLVESLRLRSLKSSFESHCAILAAKQINVVNMPVAEWNGGMTTMVHRFGLLAFGWDAQLPRTLSSGLRMGLDAVYSDVVDVMVDVYTNEIGHQPRR